MTKLLTVHEAAEALRLRPSTIRMWILKRSINSFRVGRAVRISAEEIDRILRAGLRPAGGGRLPQAGGG
jgi:excisionase family DNA binding protein